MLKAAIEKIASMAAPVTFEIDGHTYASEDLVRIDRPKDTPSMIAVTGLDSICKLIRTESDRIGTTIFVQVESYKEVSVWTTYLDDFSRYYLYRAKADVPGCRSGYRDRESALVELRSLFLPGAGVDYLLDLLSRVSDESKVTTTDNGVTQSVEASQGVFLKAIAPIKPRVELAPFRTFLEVPQPVSEFLLRVQDGGNVGLFEADGGVWKLEAKDNIVKYFEGHLSDLVDAGRVVVMM